MRFGRWEWALFLIVLGARLAVFDYAGSPVPYYDQWVAEFHNTFLQLSMGQEWSALFSRHNEHLLVTTKLLTILGYTCNDYWDVPFLAICSGAVHALTAAWMFQLISCSLHARTKTLLWMLSALIFAVPYAGFNALCGMQVSFYLVDFALLWSLSTVTNWSTPLRSGASLVCATLFGLLSFGSGVAIPIATLGAHFCHRKARPGFWLAWGMSMTASATYVITTLASHANHQSEFPSTYAEIVRFWLVVLSWPTNQAAIGLLITCACLVGLVYSIRHNQGSETTRIVLAGVCIYAAANSAMIAINRDLSMLHMRYWDTIALFTLGTLALGLHWTEHSATKRPAWLLLGILGTSHAIFGSQLLLKVSRPYIMQAHEHRDTALKQYRDLFLRQDFDAEQARINRILTDGNHPFFDDPLNRYIIHPATLANIVILRSIQLDALNLLSPEIIPEKPPSPFSRFTNALIRHGWWLFAAGTCLALTAINQAWRDPGSLPTPPSPKVTVHSKVHL